MKKTFKFRRWMAFLLALILIATTCISSSDAFLRATGDETEEAGGGNEESSESDDGDEEESDDDGGSDDSDYAEAVEIIVEEEPEYTEESTSPEDTETPGGEASSEESGGLGEEVTPEEGQNPEGTIPPENITPAPEQSGEGQNYAYDIYFYYGDIEGQHIEGAGALDALILESAQVTVVKETVEFEGQKYDYATTENEDGRITENREANTVKVKYTVSAGNVEEPTVETPEEAAPQPVAETYSLKFNNDSEKGSVKIVSASTEAVAENTYEKGTEVTFVVSAKEGFEVSTVKVSDDELKSSSKQDGSPTYKVILNDTTVVEVTYTEAEMDLMESRIFKMQADQPKTYTVTISFIFKDNATTMEYPPVILETTASSIDGLDLQTNQYPVIDGHKCVSYAFENGVYRSGTRMYFGKDEKGNPIDKTEYKVELTYSRCGSLILFDTNGGDQIASKMGEAGESIDDRNMPIPKRGEDKFEGWYENGDFSGSPVKQLPERYPEGVKIYYAKWEEKKAEAEYKVEYRDVDSGEEIKKPVMGKGTVGDVVYAEQYTEEIEEYTFETSKPDAIELDSDSAKNIITLYYKKGVEEEKGPSVKIKKTADQSSYIVGEIITYSVEVENTGDCDLENVILLDTMWNGQGGIDKKEISFGDIKRAETKTQKYTYQTQQSDAGQRIRNKVELTGENASADIEEGSKLDCDVLVEGNAMLALSKEIINLPADGLFGLGDVICYKVTAKNTGNMTLTDIEITDMLTGIKSWKPDKDKLEPLEEVSFETTYEVTETDVKLGSVSNTVTGTAKDGNGNDATVTPATKDVAVAMKKPGLFVEKIVKDEAGKQYSLGDTVEYEIIITNNGEVPVNHIGVSDEAAGLKNFIDSLPAGESVTYDKVTYKIQEGDVQKGTFTNTVKVVGYYGKDNKQQIETSNFATVQTVPANAHLTVSKKTISTPKNGTAYTLGEIITYKIGVVNDGNQTLTNVVVKDDLTGGIWEIGTLAPGASRDDMTTTYEVTQADIMNGSSITNVAVAGGCSPDPLKPVEVTPGEVTDNIAETNADFTIEKKAAGNGPDKFYELNELVDYTITVTNTGNVTLTSVLVTDELTQEGKEFKNIAPNTSQSFTTQYKVTEDDVNQSYVLNIATAEGKFANGKEKYDKVEEIINTAAKNPHLTISKKIINSPANGVTYALGETIEYAIGVVNDGNQTLRNVVLEDSLTGEKWVIDEIKPGESNTTAITTSYKVTAADIANNGEVVNVVTATGIGLDPDKDVTPGKAVAYTEAKEAKLVLEKRVVGNDDNKRYKLGEEVKYILTVKNAGNVDINEIGVNDFLTDKESWSIGTLKPNEQKEILTTPHRVTEQEVVAGEVVNKANAWGKPSSGGDLNVEATAIVKTEGVNSHLKLDKVTTSTPADGIAYKLGETIRYKISVLNDGNVTLHNVKITDPLTKQTWLIKEIAPNQSSTVMYASYVVGEEDIKAGKVVNEVLVTSVDEKDPRPEVTGGRVEDDTEGQSRLLVIDKKVTSTPANGIAYALGETVTYEIRAWNKGNQTLKNVKVDDKLTGNTWTIPEIKPGQRSVAMTTSYVVQEVDILNRYVYNVASAYEPQPPTDQPGLIVEPGEVTAPVVAENPSLFAKKEAKDINKSYAPGDEVEYTISVVNNGNETIYNIDIVDDLTGDVWHIDRLATDGKPETFTTKYTVTEEDIRNGNNKIVNVVTVKGLDPKGNTVETEATEMVNTVPLQVSMSVAKTVLNPKTQYDVDDIIQYQIAVRNTSNVTLHNVRVLDQLNSGSNGSVIFTDLAGGMQQSNGDILFSELAAGEEKFIRCEYTVVRGDANVSISNKAVVTSNETTGPVEDTTDDTPVEKLYTLIIHYVYATGGTAAEDYVGHYLAGESFGIRSPEISGYRPDLDFVRSSEGGMPALKDGEVLELTVTYRRPATPEPTDPTDPTPTPGPTDPTPTPGPTDPTDPTPTPGPADPTPTPGPADPTPTPGPEGPTPADTPDNPIPVAVVPVAPTPVAEGVVPIALDVPEELVALGDEEVAGAVLELDENGDPVLRSVTDDRVPLTNRDLDDHKCCILSFLLMLATWLIYTWYTHSMKKHQEKLAELKDQLEEGTLKKQLGISDDWQATM